MSATTKYKFDCFVYCSGALRCNFADGYTDGTTNGYHYYIRDHQGNNRVVAKYDGTIEQTTHYYPYGGILSQSTNQGVQKFKYNGKEFDTMHGLNMYDYGARQLDPTTGLFTSMDPLCEKYYNISPYSYCAGNPVNRIDPDGCDWYQFGEQRIWRNSTDDSYKDKDRNIWKNIGHTYTDDKSGTYYSLFGQKYDKNNKDLKAVSTIDKAVIDCAMYAACLKEYQNYMSPFDCETPSQNLQSMDIYKFDKPSAVEKMLEEHNSHHISYGGDDKPNTTIYALNNKKNALCYGNEVCSQMDLIDSGGSGGSFHGIGIRFQNLKGFDVVTVRFSKNIGKRNQAFYMKLINSYTGGLWRK